MISIRAAMTRSLIIWLIVCTALVSVTKMCGQDALWSVAGNVSTTRFSTNGQRIAVMYATDREQPHIDSVVVYEAASGLHVRSVMTWQKQIVGSDFVDGDSILAVVWMDTVGPSNHLIIERVNLGTGRRIAVASIDVHSHIVTARSSSITSNGSGHVAIGTLSIAESSVVRQLHVVETLTGVVTPVQAPGYQDAHVRGDTLMVLNTVRDQLNSTVTRHLSHLRLPMLDTIRHWRLEVTNMYSANAAVRADGRLLFSGAVAYDIRDSVVRTADMFVAPGTVIGTSGWALQRSIRTRPRNDRAFQFGFELRDIHGVQGLSWFVPNDTAYVVNILGFSHMLADSSRYAFFANALYRLPPLPPVADHAIGVNAMQPVIPCATFSCRSFAHLTRAVTSYEWSVDGGPWIRADRLDTAIDRPTPYLVRLRTTYADGSVDTLVRALAHDNADTNIIAVACYDSLPTLNPTYMTYHGAGELLIYNGVAPSQRPAYYRTTPPTIRRTSQFDDLHALAAWAPDGQPYLFTLHDNPTRSTPLYYVASIVRRDLLTGTAMDTVCNVTLGRPHAYTAVVAQEHQCFYAPGRRRLILNMRFTFQDTISGTRREEVQSRMIRIDPERGRYVSRTPELRGTTNWSTFVQLEEVEGWTNLERNVLDLDDIGSQRSLRVRQSFRYVDDAVGIYDSLESGGIRSSWTFRLADGSLIRRINAMQGLRVDAGPATAQSMNAFWVSSDVTPTLLSKAGFIGPFVDLESDSVVMTFGLIHRDFYMTHAARSVDGRSVFIGTYGKRYVLRIPEAAAVKLRIDPVSVVDDEPLPAHAAWFPRQSIASSADQILLNVPTDIPWTIHCVDLHGRTIAMSTQLPLDGTLVLEAAALPTGTFAFQCSDGANVATLLLQRIDTVQP